MRIASSWAARAATVAGTAALAGALLVPPAQAAPPTVWVHNSADHVFASSAKPAGAPAAITLHAARGEVESAQLLVRPDQPVTGVQLAVNGPLTGPNGATIAVDRVALRRQYEHLNIHLGGAGTEVGRFNEIHQPPDGSNHYYDALVENTPRSVAANYTQAYHYSLSVPSNQAPGTYTGTVVVRSSAGDVPVSVTVTVYDVTLPKANESAFKLNNWFTSVGWDYGGTERAIPYQYDNAQPYSPNWWTVIGNFAKNQAKHRNNVVYADFQALLIPGTTIDDAGNFTFDWSNFDRFVELFETSGAMQYIYTPTLLEPHPDLGGTRPQLEMLVKENGRTVRKLVDPNTPATTAYLRKIFPALKAHLDAKGWTDQFYMSALDEPTHPNQATAAKWLYDIYDDYFPEPLTNEAHGYTFLPDAADNITTVTPYTENYEQNAGYWQQARRSGKEMWLYTCIVPEHYHMNRLIGMPLAKTRLLPWLIWKVGGTGYLHWAWNYWHRWTNNSEDPNYNTFDGVHTGDTFIVRPNRAALDVYDSIRSETQLDGQEDFELLTMLARTKPNTARAIVESIITDLTGYDRSGAVVEDRHRQLLAALTSSAPDIGTDGPFSDDFSTGMDNLRFKLQIKTGQPVGAWRTESGELVQPSVGGGWDAASAAVEGRSYTDLVADVDVRITGVSPTGGNANWAGLTVRNVNATDFNTGYLAAIRNNGEVFLFRGDKELAKAQVPGYQPGQWTHLRVIAQGTNVRVYVGANPAPLITVTDDAYQVGHVAVVTGGVSARFDNLRVNPGTNPAVGAAVQPSSSYDADGWHSRFLVDGYSGAAAGATGWSSHDQLDRDHAESVRVDLGRAVRAGRIDLFARADGANTGVGFPSDFTVEVSTDNATWTTVASRTSYPRPGAGAQSFPFAARDVRYVRVTGTKLSQDPNGHYRMQLGELQLAGGNYAAGRTVTASSSAEYVDNGWRRSALTDGVVRSALGYSMGYSSEPFTTDASVGVDLGGPTVVSEVSLYARNDELNSGAGFPSTFQIQTSVDGASWTAVVSRSGLARPDERAQRFSFPPVTARHVRLVATAVHPAPGNERRLQLAELEVR